MRRSVSTLFMTLAAAVLLTTPRGAFATKCDDADPTGSLRAGAREDVVTNCTCDQSGATNHGQYVKCSANRLKNNATLPKSCRGQVQKCAAKSVCGKPNFIICCKQNAKGKVSCSPKKDCSHCVAPKNGNACCSTQTSCCKDDATASCSATPPLCSSPSGAFIDGGGSF
jgi:hypothetical protein